MANAQKGSKYDDAILGSDLVKQGYHDNIMGLAGNDYLFGGLSRDNLQGGGGDDTLEGGQGDDLLIGNGGLNNDYGVWLRTEFKSEKKALKALDKIIKKGGGPGSDTFVFNAGDGHDLIAGFEVGVDRLVFNGIAESSLTFTVNYGIPMLPDTQDGDGVAAWHWGYKKASLVEKNGDPILYTTISYDGGEVDVVGVAATSLDDLM